MEESDHGPKFSTTLDARADRGSDHNNNFHSYVYGMIFWMYIGPHFQIKREIKILFL